MQVSPKPKRRFRVLYLFSGAPRKSDVRSCIQQLCIAKGVELEMVEVDLILGDGHDLNDDEKWEEIAKRIKQGDFDAIIMSPPCSTWSRAVWSNKIGPRPVRSRDFPHGFPWLKGELKEKAAIGSKLVLRCVEVLDIAPPYTVCVWEHPEDLGRSRNGVPASVWQLEEVRRAAKKRRMETIAFHQCTYGADYPKPTRLLSDAHGLLQLGYPGWPVLNKELYYLGPLPRACGHERPPLIGTNTNGGFKTGPTAAYPIEMNQMLANLVFLHWFNQALTPAEGVTNNMDAEPAGERRAEDPALDLVPKLAETQEAKQAEKRQGAAYAMRNLEGKVYHDGAGLCSEGNKRPAFRKVSAMVSLGEQFLQLTSEEEMRRDLYRLALGKCNDPPFRKEVVERARQAWLECLAEKSGLAVAELSAVEPRQPFLLAAIGEHLKVIEDPDAEAFSPDPGTFRTGVPLGVQGMPRVPAVFEAKEKWRKYEEVPWPSDKENYLSAAENAVAVQGQFRKEEALGAMVEVDEEEAREQYGDGLRIAALAALEKADNTFRVVHDATHNVGVNSQIKVEDQLRYPGPMEIKMALQALHPATFVLTADVARAHRLVLVRRQDWGYQACRTGVDDSGEPSRKIWLNTVGTFGVTSASYHFTRLFAAVSRCAQSLLGRRDVCQLIYVDDLLFIAHGLGGLAAVWTTLLFLLVAGTPFSWGKCKGGTHSEWVLGGRFLDRIHVNTYST